MLTLLVTLWFGCSGGADEAEADEQKVQADPRTLVEVAPVVRGGVGDHIGASASIESDVQATLVPETQGTVAGLYAEEGDIVTRGQLLAVLASPTLDAAYARAGAELERATAEATSAERLFAQGALSKAEVDLARQALGGARTAHEEASRTRGFARMESPIDGTVASRSLRFGELAGGSPAFTIVDLSRLRVVVSLPERDLARVRPGLPATLTSAYNPLATGAGVVERVAPVVDPASGTFRVIVRLPPPEPGVAMQLRPGQFASVRIEVDRHEGVLTIPRRALVWEEGKAYVFQIVETTKEAEEKEEKKDAKPEKKGGFSFDFGGKDEEESEAEIPGPWRKAKRLEVRVGFEDGDIAELLSGVEEGASLVVVGNQALRDAARVRLPEDPTLAPKKEEEPKKEDAPEPSGTGDAAAADATEAG